MTTKILVVILALAVLTTPLAGGMYGLEARMDVNLSRLRPRPPEKALAYSIWRTAPITVALVFGRAAGCADADPALVELTAREAIHAGLDPAIAAATVAVESSCNTLALSGKAVGLMQIRPSAWQDKYDFAQVNLLNRADNLKVGTEIMASLINQYGVTSGVQHYNGTGKDCASCDGGYSSKILSLAHK